jgi:hypothetical protein
MSTVVPNSPDGCKTANKTVIIPFPKEFFTWRINVDTPR